MDIAAWLRGLGLERYETAFRDNEIDWDTLPKLTTEDLKDLGVVLGGHRRKLLEAIAALRSNVDATPERAAVAPTAERRPLTVMFCDLVGSTALAARLDPEDLREVINEYLRVVANVVGKFDGFVARYMGDGVLAYFGYPRAHEDDAERAVRASLAVVEAVRRLETPELLKIRIGLATGLAVVGDLIGSGAAREQAVVGETPNPAARLQLLAAANEIVIAENTRRLIGSLFEYESLGKVELKDCRRLSGPFVCSAKAGAAAGSRRCAPAKPRLSGAAKRSTCYCGAGRGRSSATANSCWSPARRASASRASPRHWRNASIPNRISACAISARPITRTARCFLLSTSSAGRRGSHATTRPGSG